MNKSKNILVVAVSLIPLLLFHTPMVIIGKFLMYAGVVSLFTGYFGIVFCGFATSTGRGIMVLIFPFLGLGDAMRRFHFLVWLWLGGVAGIIIGSLFVR